jgi:Fur family ferric uptake transcriptional regulator
MAFRMKTSTPHPKPPRVAAPFDSETLLRDSGLRVTRAAQTVLELLARASQPLTHEDVAAV